MKPNDIQRTIDTYVQEIFDCNSRDYSASHVSIWIAGLDMRTH